MSIRINEPAFIDPVNGQESEGISVIDAVYDSLLALDPFTSKLVPAAAESWEANDDASVWTFHLNKKAKFTNGRAVTAADFKYAFERICNPTNKSEIAYHLESIVGYDKMQDGSATELSGVKAVDDYTLEITLTAPFGDFEYVMAHPTFAPVPKEEVDKDPVAFAAMPIGNGQFKMAGPWQHDQLIQLVRNDDYYGKKAQLDGVDFKIIKDVETALLEFKAGNLDFTDFAPDQTASLVAEYGESDDGYTVSPGKQVLGGAEAGMNYVTINLRNDIFKGKPDLCRAISLAINRQAIIDAVYDGLRTVADGIVPPGIAGYTPGQWQYSKYDMEEAKSLLAKAGYPNGEGLPVIKMGFNTGSVWGDVFAMVQADLQKIGIQTELEGVEWAQWLDQLQAGTPDSYQLGRIGWSSDFPIYQNWVGSLFTTGGADNLSGYSDPAVDAAIADARATANTDERLAKYLALDKTIGDASPVAPLFIGRHSRVGSNRINGLVYSALNYYSLDNVWISAEKQ